MNEVTMRKFREDIWSKDEYDYAAAYGFVPNIRAYIHDETDGVGARDCMLVLPGGGYCVCAPHEGEPVALDFYDKGMNTFVLTYSTDITMSVPLKKQPLWDVSRAVRFIRKRAAEYGIEGGRLIICGFSAASHVCGSLAVHYADVKDGNPEYKDISNRPDGVILSYPVITTGKYTHESSIQALLGKDAPADELEYFSLEKQVKEDTPPCFLWQTKTDELVPVENSYLFAQALQKAGVPYAHYVFPEGIHGLGLCTKEVYEGGGYAMEQVALAIASVKAGRGVNVSSERRAELEEQFKVPPEDGEGGNDAPPGFSEDLSRDVGKWTELAKIWIDRL